MKISPGRVRKGERDQDIPCFKRNRYQRSDDRDQKTELAVLTASAAAIAAVADVFYAACHNNVPKKVLVQKRRPAIGTLF